MQASTVWILYSMLRSTLLIYENVDISTYHKLLALLKRNSDGYVAKNSKVLTMTNVEEFLKNAKDEMFLVMKVVLIFCLNGACRLGELCKLTIHDITDNGTMAIVHLRDNKTKKNRFFAVTDECNARI